MTDMDESKKGWVVTVSLKLPTLQDNTADTDRLLTAVKTVLKTDTVGIDLKLVRQLPALIRKSKFRVVCILFKDQNRWILIDIKDATDTGSIAGLAVDLGTTRVVLRLVDLINGQPLADIAFDNPQISIGPDILARIHFTNEPDGLKTLNKLIIQGLNHKVDELCRSCNVRPEDVYLLSLAGNTAMTHLFMGIDPHWIIREPYIPVINRPGLYRAQELGIKINPFARALIFPNVGSYFGGDLIAGILYSGLNNQDQTAVLVDVGTNAEVVVGNKNWLIACAGAAGPALEGGVTRMGMMAGPGVIDKVTIDPDTLEFKLHTIEDEPPIGICGSGLIDLAAQLFIRGMVDFRGRINPLVCKDRLVEIDGLRHLVVVPEISSASGARLSISQADLDSLIRSKAAMYAILETITSRVGVALREIKTFYLAGTFGSFINPESAISIGMIPDLPIERYQSLGNSSLCGAAMALRGEEYTEKIDEIRDRITYLELNVSSEFMNRFSAAKFLPHTDLSLFPSVVIKK